MPEQQRPFPPALPHGPIEEVLPGLFFVTGTVPLPGPLPVRFSRAMTIAREGDRLILINTLRLSEPGLDALDALGRVTDVIRLAANHGMDDPFYKDRYGAKVWAVRGQRYTAGFDTDAAQTYFTPDAEMDASTALPLARSRLAVIDSAPPEGVLFLDQDGGVVVAGDCLQNWASTDAYFSTLGKVMMRMMGFIKPCNVGPGWLKQGRPPTSQIRALLDQPFDHVLPSHGTPVLGGAKEAFRAAIQRVSGSR